MYYIVNLTRLKIFKQFETLIFGKCFWRKGHVANANKIAWEHSIKMSSAETLATIEYQLQMSGRDFFFQKSYQH